MFLRVPVIMLLLLPLFSAAQPVHQKDLLGKWYLQKVQQNGKVMIDRSDTAAVIALAVQDGRNTNPFFYEKDSADIVNNVRNGITILDRIYQVFYADGRMEVTHMGHGHEGISDVPDTGSYTLNEQTSMLTTRLGGSEDSITVAIENKILITRVELPDVKVEMEWRRKQ